LGFGDGMSLDEKELKSFEYLYQYPGEYVLSLDYYQSSNYNSLTPDASDKMIIKVISSDVIISSVGNENDPYVEIQNKSNYEVILSGWNLRGINKSFLIPKGTAILANKKIRFSPKITGFNNLDIKSVSLIYPRGEIVSQYPAIKNQYSVSKSSTNLYPTKSIQNNSNVINLNDLSASAENAKTKIPTGTLAYLGLIGVLILGGGAVYFARRENFTTNNNLEENLRADDIRILE